MSDQDEREQSDLFSLRQPMAAKASIPPVAEVLTPPEELRKQRVRKIIAAVIATILVSITAYTVYHFAHQASVESSALTAGDTGRASDVRDALDTLGGSEAPGLQARLHAMLAVVGEIPIDEAQAVLDAVPAGDEEEASERYKAQTYLAIARGDAAAAAVAASHLIPVGTFASETAHAKSLAAFVNGDIANAVAEARGSTSVEAHAHAPRYVGQLALALEISGDRDGALAALEAAGEADAPAARIAKARILARARRDEAMAEAQAVLDAETALPSEKAWAHLVQADVFATRGAREDARAAATRAREATPPGDVLFRWRLAEVLLRAESPTDATAILDGLSGPVADAPLAGRVNAWLLLSRNEVPRAVETLAAVPASPSAWLLVGLAQERSGNLDEARGYYERVAGDTAFAAEGLAARARLELAAGNHEDASRFARQALEAAPHHPAIVPVAVGALLAQEQTDAALSVAQEARSAHANDVRVLGALADAQLAKRDFEGALESTRAAVERAPGDAELQAKRGEAARGRGEAAEAREAYEKALEIEAAHPIALVGLLHLDVGEGNLDHAQRMIDKLEEASIDTDEVALLRVRYLVASGAGVSGTRYVLRAGRRSGLRRNGFVRRALAELYLQAELFRPAVGMFQQAARMGEERVDMWLGVAMAHALDRKTNFANEALTQALEAGLPEGAAEGTESPAARHPRFLAVRARMELNLGRFVSAQRYAERALEADSHQGEARLVLGEVALRQRANPTEHLEAALRPPHPQPTAAALLARRNGANETGCAYARRYVRASNRRATYYEGMEGLIERCGD